MFTKTQLIADHELGLLYRDRMFEKVLGPGKQTYSNLTGETYVLILDLRDIRVDAQELFTLRKTHPEVIEEHFAVADVGDSEIGLVFADNKLAYLLHPAQTAFYANRFAEIRIEIVDAEEQIEVPKHLIAPMSRIKNSSLVQIAQVPNEHVGLLYVEGALTRQLTPGRYAFYQAARPVTVAVLDQRLDTFEVTGQEVLTKDRIGVRANLTAVYRIADPVKAVSAMTDIKDYLYKALQFALREVVGTRTLEDVLGEKESINAALTARVVPNLAESGIEISTIGVKDIILPGDVRELMNRVIEAEKMAQANVIKRREETAATRSLLNTAKLMEDNPILLRLKELEALEKVSEKVGNVIVGNGMDGVLDDLVRIKPRAKNG